MSDFNLTEDDCEDQGFCRIEDGCPLFKCQTWEPGADKPTHPKLVITKRHGRLWWTCPKCGGNYGEVWNGDLRNV